MKNTLLTAAAIALGLGMENKQKAPKSKIIAENSSVIRAAIQRAMKALKEDIQPEVRLIPDFHKQKVSGFLGKIS